MKSLWFVFLMLLSLICSAQRQDANWVFGYRCGLEFEANGTVTTYPMNIRSHEVGASISDSNGKLLLYVGQTDTTYSSSKFSIYNAQGIRLLNGDSLLIHSSATNGAVFLEIIEDSIYYLVHTNIIDGLCYDLGGRACMRIYLTKIQRLGSAYYVSEKNRLISNTLVTEKLAVTRHANGKDWWVVTQANNANEDSLCTNEYIIYKIGKEGVTSSSQRIGRLWCSYYAHAGEMVFSKQGDKLASAIGEDYYVRMMDFNRCTGELSAYRDTFIHSFRYPYSVEFSANEEMLYVSFGAGSPPEGVIQINTTNGRQTLIWDYNVKGSPGQLQLGPDGKVYLASFRFDHKDDTVNKHLTVINFPDSAGLACGLSGISFYVGDSCRVTGGLPNMPNYNLGALPIYIADAGKDTFYCIGDNTVKAFPIGGELVQGVTYEWAPAPGIDTLNAPRHLVFPTQSRWYYVTLTDTNYVGPSCNSRIDSVYVEVRDCDTVGIKEVENVLITVFPNPVSNVLNIVIPEYSQGLHFSLYSLLGERVMLAPISSSSTSFALQFPAGLYFYSIERGREVLKKDKLVIEH